MRKCCVVPCLFAALAVAVDAVVAQVGLSPIRVEPSSLFVIDQHRTTVVERIVNEWGDRLAISGVEVTREQLREILFVMRADQLLAARLAGSVTGSRDVLAIALIAQPAPKASFLPA